MTTVMPDIAHSTLPQSPRRLERVGMTQVEIPLLVQRGGDPGSRDRIPALASGFVSLDDPSARGIHMSRLYKVLAQELPASPLSPEHLSGVLNRLLESHQGLSHSAEVVVSYTHLASMPALLSGLESWRHYPVVVRAQRQRGGAARADLAVQVTYSSTCPCSAALSRQLNQKRFAERFGQKGQVSAAEVSEWMGTEDSVGGEPHAQRSIATAVLRFEAPVNFPDIESLVSVLENRLGTPVQSAVKREDEQEFARLNARNLMFSEDAARRLAEALDNMSCSDFVVNVCHYESLHPYDVQASATKGVTGGLQSSDLLAMQEFFSGKR